MTAEKRNQKVERKSDYNEASSKFYFSLRYKLKCRRFDDLFRFSFCLLLRRWLFAFRSGLGRSLEKGWFDVETLSACFAGWFRRVTRQMAKRSTNYDDECVSGMKTRWLCRFVAPKESCKSEEIDICSSHRDGVLVHAEPSSLRKQSRIELLCKFYGYLINNTTNAQ